MGFFLTLFLLLIFWYLLRPAIRLWLVVRHAQRQANDFFRSASGNERTSSEQNYRARQHQNRRRSGKKIDPNVGEYVDFEEITVYQHSSPSDSGKNIKFTSESQIEDAEWEDVK